MAEKKPVIPRALVRELAQHAFALKGAQQSSNVIAADVLDYPAVKLPCVQWGEFFVFDVEGDQAVARMPVLPQRLPQLQQQYPMIQNANWVERDGHVNMVVPLNAGIPAEFLKQLIDEAYAIVWNKLDTSECLQIELGDLPYDEPKLMDRLAEIHNLEAHQEVIRKLARAAHFLRTRKSSETKIPLGATKIGGRPDLPADIPWPAYQNGKPLAFLAQLNLAEVGQLGAPLKWLPKECLLSVFSVWGWVDEGNPDPQTPDDYSGEAQDRKSTRLNSSH